MTQMKYSSKPAELKIVQERITSQIGRGNFSTLATPVTDTATANRKVRRADSLVLVLNPAITFTTAQLSFLSTLTNRQKDTCEAYWYHTDHLGSSSWITDSAGNPVQHLHYLPWGEDYVNQRLNDFDGVRYTFSAKEKDSETGYSYFGSRYYNSDLSIWLSVDPMADKYPSLSPYTYCANNSVKIVDPNGEDLVKVTVPGKNNKTQKIIVDSKIADKVIAFTKAMYEKYGVVVTSSFRSKTRQAQMRKDWDEGRRTGLLYKPALKSAHSSGFAIDMNVSSLVNSGEVTVDELSDFAKEYGFNYGGKDFNDIPHFYIDEKQYYKNRDEASDVNDKFYNSHSDIPEYEPESKSQEVPSERRDYYMKDNLTPVDKVRVQQKFIEPIN